MAWRFATSCRPMPGSPRCSVKSEDTEFAFGADYDCTGLNIGRVDSSHEGEFDPDPGEPHSRAQQLRPAAGVPHGEQRVRHRRSGPARLRRPVSRRAGDGKPGVQSRVSRRLDDRSLIARAAVGANGAGSPWRVIMLGDELGNLIESNLIGNLNPPAGVRHVVDQARQDRLGLVVGSLSAAAGQGRHRHADHQDATSTSRRARASST